MTCDIQDLLDEASCYACMEAADQATLRLCLLTAIAGGPAENNAYFFSATFQTQETLKLTLLCAIAGG
jgi:hypothetical protein